MNKIGFIILILVWPVSYYLKHIDPVKNQLMVDYFITFGYCFGTSLISFYYGRIEKNRVTKYLFFYAISIFGILIISTYLIDFIVDPIFKTTKVIWSIIISTFITLCVYFFSRKS